MPKQTALYLPANVNNSGVNFVNSDGVAFKNLYTAGNNDSDVYSIIAASNDSSVRAFQLAIQRSSINYPLGTISIPTGAGGTSAAVPSVDMINSTSVPGLPVNGAGKRYISLRSGENLVVAPMVAFTAGATGWVSAFGQDY